MTQNEANALNTMKQAVRESWISACNLEGIPTDSKFVVFSDANTEAVRHNELMGEFLKMRNRIARNISRRERHAAMTDLGLKRVKGALGGTYYE